MGRRQRGDHVVAARALFGSCRYVVEEHLPRFGVASTLVDGRTSPNGRPRSAQHEGLLPRKPGITRRGGDRHRGGAELARSVGAKLIVDNVFATPLWQKPLALGADCVVYSATKHIDGRGAGSAA